MIVKTLWFWRKGEEGPELLEAWDEISIDGWDEGWRQACEKALKSVEGDISEAGHRVIDIDVDYDEVSRLFWETPTIPGAVAPSNTNEEG